LLRIARVPEPVGRGSLLVVARTLLIGVLVGGFAVVTCAALAADDVSQPVADEALQVIALNAIFPGMQVSVDRNKMIDHSWPQRPKASDLFLPDALAGTTVYRVLGKAMNEAEECASGDVITGKLSTVRQVRFELYWWPNEGDSGLLAVIQYDFPSANPPMACPSIGLLVHLIRDGANWVGKGRFLLETVHHHSLQAVRLMDLTGRGANQLVVESNWGGAGVAGSSLQVFDLSRGSFDEVLATESRMQHMTEDLYTQVLNAGRTRASYGQQFCVSKTTLLEDGRPIRPPRVTHPCYRRGEGVDSKEIEEWNKMLEPLR